MKHCCAPPFTVIFYFTLVYIVVDFFSSKQGPYRREREREIYSLYMYIVLTVLFHVTKSDCGYPNRKDLS